MGGLSGEEQSQQAKNVASTLLQQPARAALWRVLDPRGPFHLFWDMLLLIQLAYLVVQVPFVVCFGVTYRPRDAMGVIEVAIDATFALDVLVNFSTGLWDEETQTLNTDRAAIARAYARGWLVPDVLSALPYEWFVLGAANLLQLIKAARIVKLLRVLRVVKLVKLRRASLLMRQLDYVLGPSLLQLLKLCLSAALLAHLIGCVFYSAAHTSREDDTWIKRYGIHDASIGYKYLVSLYFTVSTLSTVGFGDVAAVSDGEQVVAILSILLGLTVFTSFVSSVSSLLGDINSPEAKARQRLQQLESFLSQRSVPRALLRRVAEHHRAASLQQLSADEVALIDELSSPLRNELVLFLFSGVLERLPFFHSKRPSFTAAIATHLRLEYAEPGEVIMRQGELGEVLYFVADGQLDVCVDNAPAEPPPAPKALPPARTAGASPAAGSRPAGSGGSGGGVAGVLRAGDGFGEYSALLGEQNRTE